MQHRLLSIDPGTQNVGICISDISDRMIVRHAATFNVKNRLKNVVGEETIREYGKKRVIRSLISQFILEQIKFWQPSAVISEVPYLNESLNSFLSLYDCNQATKEAIFQYSKTMQFIGIDPASAKKSLGIPGNSGDKELVYNQVTTAPHIDLSEIYPDQLDEHAIDAILIGNAYYQHYLKYKIKEPLP